MVDEQSQTSSCTRETQMIGVLPMDETIKTVLIVTNLLGIGFFVVEIVKGICRRKWKDIPAPLAIGVVYLAGFALLTLNVRLTPDLETHILATSSLAMLTAYTCALFSKLISGTLSALVQLRAVGSRPSVPTQPIQAASIQQSVPQ